MNNFVTVLRYIFIGIIAWYWLYVAARTSTTAIMRSIEEWKERKRNG
ncbi:MAG: hypothetical protein ACTSO3_01385 [Candidatus Heimdallarchaeaceae archaeon]